MIRNVSKQSYFDTYQDTETYAMETKRKNVAHRPFVRFV